jgi:hypothetical protein
MSIELAVKPRNPYPGIRDECGTSANQSAEEKSKRWDVYLFLPVTVV